MNKYFDNGGIELQIGDIVIFGEKNLQGEIIEFTKENGVEKIKVKVEELISDKLWRWIYVFPAGQAKLDEVEVDMDFDSMTESEKESWLKVNNM